jgi:hypothetical protein
MRLFRSHYPRAEQPRRGAGEKTGKPTAERFAAIPDLRAFSSLERVTMAEITKRSVEKALEKLRASDARQSKDTLFNDKIVALDEEI